MSELSFNDLLNLSSQGLPTIAGEPVTSQYLKILQEWGRLRLRGEWPMCCAVPVSLCVYDAENGWPLCFDSWCSDCGLTPIDPEDDDQDGISPYSSDLETLIHYWRQRRLYIPPVKGWRGTSPQNY